MTLPNRNLKTGIRYGCISANSLDPDVVDTLLYARVTPSKTWAHWETVR